MSLSQQLIERIQAEFPKYPEKRAVLLTALHFVQEEQGGWVSPEVIPQVAALLEIHPIDVKEVVSFYHMFHEHPVGRNHLQVCTNLSCALRGARGLVRRLEGVLGARPGETTADGEFSIEEVQCLGSCGSAPVVQVNNEPYLENIAVGDVETLVAGLRSRRRAAVGE